MNDLLPRQPEFVVNTTTDFRQYLSDVTAIATGGYAFVWQSETPGSFRSPRFAIDLTIFGEGGARTLAETELGAVIQRYNGYGAPSVTQTANGSLVTAWALGENVQSFASSTLIGRALDLNAIATDFTLVNAPVIFTTSALTSDLAPLAGGGFAVVYDQRIDDGVGQADADVRSGAFSANGAPIATGRPVNAVNDVFDSTPAITRLSDGRFVSVWMQSRPEGVAVAGRFLDSTGAPIGSEFTVASSFPQGAPPTNIQLDRVAVTEFGAGGFAAAYTFDLPFGAPFVPAGTYVALRGFDAAGNRLSGPSLVGGFTPLGTPGQSQPALATLSDGSIALSWTATSGNLGDTSGTSIVLQRFGTDGVRLGDPRLVNTSTQGDQNDSALAANSDGTLAVSWTDVPTSDAFQSDVRAQIFGVVASQGGTIGDDTLTGTAATDLLRGFGGNDSISGLGGDDVLEGGTGNDSLLGGDGDDSIAPGAGVDSADGGAGTDTASFTDLTTFIIADLGAGASFDGVTQEVLANFENAIGTAFGDSLFGTAGANRLEGRAGADTLVGGDGDDTLLGGDGDDRLDPGAGADSVDGGSGLDTLDVGAAARAIIIDLNVGATFNGLEGDTFAGIENAIGTAFADSIFGSETVANEIDGGPGGADTLYGGGDAGDTVSYASARRGVIIDLGIGLSFDGIDLDGLSGFERAIGSAFGDQIFATGTQVADPGAGGVDRIVDAALLTYDSNARGVIIDLDVGLSYDGVDLDSFSGVANARGSRFEDDIFGSAAANIIDGGAGFDRLLGGPGDDLFVLRRGEADGDTLRDFMGNGAAAGDRIQLAGYSAGSTFTPLAGNAQVWLATDAATGMVDAIRIVGAVSPSDYFFG